MGLMSKLKNMFTEEIDDFEPVKKEMIQVEIPAPKKEEKKSDDFLDKIETKVEEKKENKVEEKQEEKVVQKREEKFAFPVFFDDDDFENIENKEKLEKKVESNKYDRKEPYQGRKVEPYQGRKTAPYQGGAVQLPRQKEKPRVFKPSPVISPIYGILDQNYKKEDIITRDEVINNYSKPKEINVDDIRKKAYGTLEDDLENSLLDSSIYDKPAVFRHEEDMFDDLSTFTSDDYFTDEFIDTTDNKNKKLDDNMVAQAMETEEKKEEPDLFGLIDSMYEKGDD